MIRMSKLADYSFILLAQMTSRSDAAWSASELADRTSLPLPTVAKLMKMLAKGDVVGAQRGATGGYRLLHTPAQISAARVIEAVDGPISLAECVHKSPNCATQTLCPMHGAWNKVNSTVRHALDSVTLADMVDTATLQQDRLKASTTWA